ncbi:MAG TPA: N-acetylmuramoyl-L-alanine amidase [Puia sp.]
MTQLIYLLKTVFISGLLFSYFWIFLRNRSFHYFNRLFLISIPVLSFLLPALYFNLPEFWSRSANGSPIHLLGVAQGGLEEAVTIYAKRNPGHYISWYWIVLLISLFVTTILFVRFLKTIRYLRNLRRNKSTLTLPDATVYFVSEKGTPFSFLKSIFWGEEMDINNREGRQILRHELFHVRNNHSLDILGMELISILCWFNPFFYLIGRELKLIHEYAADAYALAEADEYEYAGLLLTKISGRPFPLTNPFFKNQIKKRIAMITKSAKNRNSMLSRLMILPVLALLICLFSFKMKTILSFHSTKTIKVVIDPGHGGIFPGARMNGVVEKDINLSISKKIQSLAKEYNVEVIMTRENDVDIAGDDLNASLDYRTGLAGKKNADLFISIHMNSTAKNSLQTEQSGFEIYVTDHKNKNYNGSIKLASSITDFIKPDYSISAELKEREGHIRVLDYATVPAIMIECGFIDNKTDLAYMMDGKNQEKIARDILEGIKKYSQADTTPVTETRATEKTVNNNLTTEVLVSNTEIKNNEKAKSVVNNENLTNQTTIETQSTDLSETDGNTYDSSGPLKKVEVDADYPGGFAGWKTYLIKSLKYPAAAVSNEVQGEVMVEFIVNTDGTIADVHAISGPKELREESVRVVQESGHWIPAMNKGVKVASYKKQPINYKLEAK